MDTHEDDQVAVDIEDQLSHSPRQSPPTITLTNFNAEKDDSKEEVAPNTTNHVTGASDSKAQDFFSTFGALIGCIISVVLHFGAIFPIILVYMIGSLCFTGSIKSSPNHRSKGIYSKMQHFETTKDKIQRLNLVTTTRIGCLALLWLAINLGVPSLNRVSLFCNPLWKWSLLCVVILLGYPCAALATIIVTTIFIGVYKKRSKFEYLMKGLENNITSLLHFASILLTWLLYFHTNNGLNPTAKLNKLGTWGFVMLLVAAFLWLLKSAAMLEWKAKAVYKRFKGRILTAGFQLYFLQIVTSQSCLPGLLPWRAHVEPVKTASYGTDKMRHLIRNSDLAERVTIEQLVYVSRMITRLAQVIQREDDGIPEIVAHYEDKISNIFGRTGLKKKDVEEFFGLSGDEVYFLLEELRTEQFSEEITCDTFQKWMVDAHKNCLLVGYTLMDAFAMVNILNRVVVGLLVVLIIFMWLLVTELVTTNVLVLMLSPILTLSFVFGETCKSFFQGIIFSFVTHPYDVGDRCIIDATELEVKSIGILTTTFLSIGSKEKMLYPHTSLATKLITNLEGKPDPNDVIELIFDASTTKSKILGFKEDLESFFESTEQRRSYEKAIDVRVKEIKSNIKVNISFRHVMNAQDVSHSQCLLRKNKQRSELLIEITLILENRQIKLATA